MSEKMEQTTTIEEVDINLDDIFNGAPGASSVVTPDTKKEPNVFSRKENIDLSFLDKKEEDIKEPEVIEEAKEEVKEEIKTEVEVKETETDKVTEDEVNEILSEGLDLAESQDGSETVAGKKRLSDMSKVFKDMIDKDQIVPFDDDKELDDYTAKDWKELIEANLDERGNKVRRETPKQFFNSLPQELQVAAKYVADGGQDLKGLFGALAQVEHARDFSIDTVEGQEHVVREYLNVTGYGNAEEVNEEIEIWKDLGKLEKQASKFKPKLDKMQEQVVTKKLQQQQQMRDQQQKASENYMSSVYNTLKDGKVGDMKVNKKTQALLYNGLVNPQYPSINGENTNLLGHLLEKYQFVEPNYSLVTEALWLLADPKGYKSQIMTKGTNTAVEQTVRKLKTAQSNKLAASGGMTSSEKTPKRRTLPRSTNIFKRF